MRDLENMIKKYWWVALLVIIAPILINHLILKPAFFKFVGKDTDWLSFWGAYIGTILSSVIAFYVLHKQLQQNHEENEANRKLQINFLEYQQKSMWLNELKTRMYDYFMAFSQNDIISLIDYYSRHDKKDDIIKEIKRMIDLMSLSVFSKKILFAEETDSEEKVILGRLKNFDREFYALLHDVKWLARYIGVSNFKDKSYALKVAYNYKNKDEIVRPDLKPVDRRIWNIISEQETISVAEIVKIRISEAMDNLKRENINEEIVRLINYEQNKINKIIQDNDATK